MNPQTSTSSSTSPSLVSSSSNNYPHGGLSQLFNTDNLTEILDKFNLSDIKSLIGVGSGGDITVLNASQNYCMSAWDGVACWYKTLAGQEAIIPCFDNLNGVNYDTTRK